MKCILCVGLGSAMGGMARYLMSLALPTVAKGFPWATLVVNVLGCALLGCLLALLGKYPALPAEWKLCLTVGLCGGLTTFSTFAQENVLLLQQGQIVSAGLYMIASLMLGLMVFLLSYTLFIR